jgi:hypothetical protein
VTSRSDSRSILETRYAYGFFQAAIGAMLVVSAALRTGPGFPHDLVDWFLTAGAGAMGLGGILVVAAPERFGPEAVESWQIGVLIAGTALLVVAILMQLGIVPS